MTLNEQQFNFKYQFNSGLHNLDAVNATGHNMGFMEWHPDTGTIENIKVNHDSQRQGIGTQLWHEAHRVAGERGITPPRHSDQRTKEGDAWARAVGGDLPQSRKESFYGPGRIGLTLNANDGE